MMMMPVMPMVMTMMPVTMPVAVAMVMSAAAAMRLFFAGTRMRVRVLPFWMVMFMTHKTGTPLYTYMSNYSYVYDAATVFFCQSMDKLFLNLAQSARLRM